MSAPRVSPLPSGLSARQRFIQHRASRLPFKAVLQGRCKLDLAGIGWKRVLGGLALYALLLPAHGWLLGVPLL